MEFVRKGIALLAAMCVLLPCMDARADWAQSSDPLAVRPAPDGGQVQAQNPPAFAWARHPNGALWYEIEIAGPGGFPTRAVVSRLWYLPTRALPLGNYSWRVRPAGSSYWSTPRPFSITSRSLVFEVPDNATLRARILAKAHPRALPPSATPFATWGDAKRADLEPFLSRMMYEVRDQTGAMPDLSDARWPLVISSPMTEAMAAQQTDIRHKIGEATRQLTAASVMWRYKRERIYLDEALKRGDQLSALDPNGPTSYANQDQAVREIAYALAKAVDILAADLDAPHKSRWLNMIRIRAEQIYGDIAADNYRLDQHPFDSHAQHNLPYLMLVATLTLGDIPEAQKWFDFSFRSHAASPSPWSGPEGGFANGTAYGEYMAGSLVETWDGLLQATGVNFYAMPWAIGFLDHAMEFTPPGSKVHAFGDGEETAPDTRVFGAFGARLVNPRAAWYVDSLGGNEDALTRLQAQYPLPVAGTRLKTPSSDSAYYPSIGWVAMHSNLGSLGRTSYYFKSSPYGSFNHSHGDQNALLVSVAGQPLLVKAGWYDWYASPQWFDWYRQTRSVNAVTFDGGKGQVVTGYEETMQHNGKITAFAAQPSYDYAEGDATAAYAGQLSMARRQVWHLRNAGNVLLVRDKLSAAVPHTYEFNIHAPTAMTIESPTSVRIALNGQSVCVRSLNPNAAFATWSGPANQLNPAESHGAFYLQNDGKSMAEFLVLVDPGCTRPMVYVAGGSVRTVTVGSQSVTLN